MSNRFVPARRAFPLAGAFAAIGFIGLAATTAATATEQPPGNAGGRIACGVVERSPG